MVSVIRQPDSLQIRLLSHRNIRMLTASKECWGRKNTGLSSTLGGGAVSPLLTSYLIAGDQTRSCESWWPVTATFSEARCGIWARPLGQNAKCCSRTWHLRDSRPVVVERRWTKPKLAEHILRLNMRQGTGARVRDLYQRFQQRPATNEVPGHLPPGTLWSLAERQPPWQESQATLDRVHIYCLQPLGGRGCREFGVGFLPVRFWTSIRESLIR